MTDSFSRNFRIKNYHNINIVRHILSRFGCWNRCEVFEGTSVRSCCDKQPCLLFLFGKGSVRSSEAIIVDWITSVTITMTISIARRITVSTTISSNTVVISSKSNSTKMTTF
ncbi:hypothetical protein BpHYR1_048968 [Brachionus plicatilis]|uniref:Uncharacterized protein n=1 Tax=Brachionus plicatilis TaxID=10195 RepID=A0A3M7PUM0_BRAPC|nr:hypothetical protein BpHYR1_048968 [Brachionus plicatilis]